MELIGTIARKTGESSILAVEAAKASRAFEIGRDSGLFYVPKVISFDAKAGVIEFERLRGLVTFFDLAVRKDKRLWGLLRKTGQALAVIHRELVLPNEIKHNLPPEWMGSSDENVFIHGDFATVNVFFHEPSGELVILDWSAAPLIGRVPIFGSRYFDILWFVNTIFSCVPSRIGLSWDVEGMADPFLKGYAREASAEKLSRLQHYLPKICRLQRKNICYLTRREHNSLYKAAAYFLSQVLMYPRLYVFLHSFKY